MIGFWLAGILYLLGSIGLILIVRNEKYFLETVDYIIAAFWPFFAITGIIVVSFNTMKSVLSRKE